MAQYYLGIDIGGTKSHALIADEQGHVVGFGECGAGSHEVVGWEGLREALETVSAQAMVSAGIDRLRLAGVGYGIAGHDWPGDRPGHIEAIEALGIPAPYALVNDTIIGLMAGAEEGWGVGVVAGTGSNSWGRDRAGREAHMTGGGTMFGEYAGGGDLVAKAVEAVALAWTMRGPHTRLADAFVARVGASGVEDLLEGLYLSRYTLSSDAAPLVFEVAAAGDSVAWNHPLGRGSASSGQAIGVIRQLGIET